MAFSLLTIPTECTNSRMDNLGSNVVSERKSRRRAPDKDAGLAGNVGYTDVLADINSIFTHQNSKLSGTADALWHNVDVTKK